jgi:hypothetical protein
MFNFINNKNYEKLDKIKNLVSSIRFTKINNEYITLEQAALKASNQKVMFPDYKDEEEFNNKNSISFKKFNSYEEYLQEKNDIDVMFKDLELNRYAGIELLNNIFKDINLGTKKETLTKLLQVSQLLHNYSKNALYINILLGSKYLEKSYNKSIFDVLNNMGTVVGQVEDFLKTIDIIMNNNPKIIPKEYFTENMIYCINNVELIKTGSDLDKIVEKLLTGDYSENIRRFKFLTSLGAQYENTAKWIPMAEPKIDEVFAPNFSTKEFRFRVLGDLDPYHFRIGVDTDCCQAIGSDGENAAIDSYINSTAGVVILEVKNDSSWGLASQSYFHYVEIIDEESREPKKAILLDNIEAGGNKGSWGSKLTPDFYRKAYATLGSYLKSKGFDIVGCGVKYTYAFEANSFEFKSLKSDPRHFEVLKHGVGKAYTDFNSKEFYDLLKPKFSFEMTNDITSIETEMSVKSARILEIYLKKSGNKKAESLYKLSNLIRSYGMRKEASKINKLIAEII